MAIRIYWLIGAVASWTSASCKSQNDAPLAAEPTDQQSDLQDGPEAFVDVTDSETNVGDDDAIFVADEYTALTIEPQKLDVAECAGQSIRAVVMRCINQNKLYFLNLDQTLPLSDAKRLLTAKLVEDPDDGQCLYIGDRGGIASFAVSDCREPIPDLLGGAQVKADQREECQSDEYYSHPELQEFMEPGDINTNTVTLLAGAEIRVFPTALVKGGTYCVKDLN